MANSSITILGCGASTRVPTLKCVLSDNDCKVCKNIAENKKNKRDTTSCLVYIDDLKKNFLLDFPTTISEKLTPLNLKEIPTLILSHEHPDAYSGLIYVYPAIPKNTIISIYTTNAAKEVLKRDFKYMFEPKIYDSSIGHFELKTVEDFNYKYSENIELIEVQHGKTKCIGFKTKKLAYFSDVSSPDALMNKNLENLDTLIVDCYDLEIKKFGHLNKKGIDEVAKNLSPKRIILTGLSHNMDYYDENKIHEYAYDSMKIDFK